MEVDGELTQTIQHHPPQQNFSLGGLQPPPTGMLTIVYKRCCFVFGCA